MELNITENDDLVYNYEDYEDDDDDDDMEGNEYVMEGNNDNLHINNSIFPNERANEKEIQQEKHFFSQVKPKPKQLTYDDILASLNMKVVNGTLQMIQPPLWQQQQQQQQQIKKVNFQQSGSFQGSFQVQNKNQIPVIEKQESIHPLQLKRQLLLNHLMRQGEIQRIKKIKSKKILFPKSNISVSQSIMNTRNPSYGFSLNI